ncbi:MAG: DUF3737 family protein [Clostridia bacterium]|nr:DUF3737 family protein [Clostridia bacterium]
MKEIVQQSFKGERALFQSDSLKIINCTFSDGESPLKESKDLDISGSLFRWKYPLWYCRNVNVKDSVFDQNTRAGIWYSDNVRFENTVISSPKNFRRSSNVELVGVSLSDAKETFWSCSGVNLKNVSAAGDYFMMNTSDVRIDGLKLTGNYALDGAENAVIRNSSLVTKDAFWNSKNISVYDSWISGEYLGWNSENLYFENCTVESLQGLCYIKNLKMKNCRLIDTTLAFEYSSVDAEIIGRIDSILNPSSGRIKCDTVCELIIEEGRVESLKTEIDCPEIVKRLDKPEWL